MQQAIKSTIEEARPFLYRNFVVSVRQMLLWLAAAAAIGYAVGFFSNLSITIN